LRAQYQSYTQADAVGVLFSKPIIELLHARLGAVVIPKPDRPPAQQVAYHDTVDVSLADGDLVNPDDLRGRGARSVKLSTHVTLLQLLDRVPAKTQLLGDLLDGCHPTASAHVVGKALGVQGIVGEKLQALPLHRTTASATHPPDLEIEVDPGVAAGEIPYPSPLAVVPTRVDRSAGITECFFERRVRVTMRAFGSPKIPHTVVSGRKPGKV
jgi:hypothetical protein